MLLVRFVMFGVDLHDLGPARLLVGLHATSADALPAEGGEGAGAESPVALGTLFEIGFALVLGFGAGTADVALVVLLAGLAREVSTADAAELGFVTRFLGDTMTQHNHESTPCPQPARSAPDLRSLLPGSIVFDTGGSGDFRALARHHYLPRPPATWAAVRVARYLHLGRSRVAACAVLSWPVPMLEARIVHFGLERSFTSCLRFANAHVRTVSRVVVHPQFRSLGLAAELVRQLIELAPTRYVESSARMARFTRFLESAGMTCIARGDASRPAYFVIDKQEHSCVPDPLSSVRFSTSVCTPTSRSAGS